MKLSICIPTFNRVKYLDRCLKSILISDDLDLEVIVQDNASEDDTESLMNSIEDKRVKYFKNQANIGMEKNIVSILKRVTGDYVIYLTDDDFLFPNAIEQIKNFIDEYKPSFFTTDIIVNLEKKKEAYRYSYFSHSQVFDSSQKSYVANLYMSAHILTRCGFNMKLFSKSDYEFLEKYGIDNLYPHQILLPLMYLKGQVGYMAESIGIHTWENETFWGIDPENSEALNKGRIYILKAIKEIIDRELFVEIIKHFSLKYGVHAELFNLLHETEKKYVSNYLEKKAQKVTAFNSLKKWLENLQMDESYTLCKEIKSKDKIKVAILGTGEVSNLIYRDLQKENICVEAFIENKKKMNTFKGINVYTQHELLNSEIIKCINLIIVSIEGEHDSRVIKELKERFNNKELEIVSWKEMLDRKV